MSCHFTDSYQVAIPFIFDKSVNKSEISFIKRLSSSSS